MFLNVGEEGFKYIREDIVINLIRDLEKDVKKEAHEVFDSLKRSLSTMRKQNKEVTDEL